MKIAIILLNQGRGSGGVAREHVESLLNLNHEVYFIHPGVGKGVPGAHNLDVKLPVQTMPVHEYLPAAKSGQKAVSTMDYEEAMSYVPAYENVLEGIISDIDLVIGHHANLTAIATANVCRRHQKPYVLFLHGTGIEPRHHGGYHNRVWDQIEKAILEANGLIVTTEYVRDELVRNLVNVDPAKFLILPCGVNIEEFHPNNTGDIFRKYDLPPQYVICPGAVTHAKGPQNVVEASKLYADLAPTIFIGDGDIREELAEKLGDRGQFLGFVSSEDKAQLINGATLLVGAPEKKEHFGIIYIEAMSGSVPVVAYEGGGVHSIVTKENGVLTKRNPKALGETIRSLLLDPVKRKAMGTAGRQRAEEQYAAPKLGVKLANWLSSACKLAVG